jgi:AraC-like DNA-binding protein
MARESDTDDLGLRIAHDKALDIMGPRVLQGVLRQPTLQSGLEKFAQLIRGESSGTIVWSSQRETSIHFHLKKAFEPGTPGFRQTEWQGLMVIVTMIRLFAGGAWQPDLLSMRSQTAIPSLAAGLFPETRFESGSLSAFVEFPRTLLSTGLSGYGEEIKTSLPGASVDSAKAVPTTDFAVSLQHILRAYLPEGYPSLSLAAEISRMSPRTLQRRLAERGISYSTLIDRTRFDIASEMLAETDATSLEIAMATGYEDSSHFARAFRRAAGCCPGEYRRRRAA